MKSVHTAAFAFLLSGIFFSHVAAAATCEEETNKLNQELAANGAASISDTTKFASTLRSLNQNGRLPGSYITSDEAKRLGWSGKDDETLWGLKPTNNKMIGGDSYRNSTLPAAQNWYSADVDVNRGYRSNKRLIYSQSSATKFISPDKYQNFLEVEPCQ